MPIGVEKVQSPTLDSIRRSIETARVNAPSVLIWDGIHSLFSSMSETKVSDYFIIKMLLDPETRLF
jgi:hypothetical protein